ncbi:hypothetical protein AMJ57_01250 [Parcubacteria bacterium SG8_24]|nr:MAG: hypothetical protein AMJ57_01250 [Parcubacteria bacterium SG8_24]
MSGAILRFYIIDAAVANPLAFSSDAVTIGVDVLSNKEATVRRRRITLVNNPRAGKGTPRAGLGRVVASILATPYRTYEPKTLAELDAVADRICQEETDMVAFCGGDGTIHQNVTRLIRAHLSNGKPLPEILLFPVGTMNNTATSLGITRYTAPQLAERVRRKIEDGRPFDLAHTHALKVNDEYGFFYGTGLPVNFLERYYADTKRRGPWRAVRVALGAFGDELFSLLTFRKPRHGLIKDLHAKIVFPEGYDPPVAPFMTHRAILAGTIDQIGLGCRALPDAMRERGSFMIRSSRLSFWGIIANSGPLWAGLGIPSTHDAVVGRTVIEYEQPTVCTVDGELKEPSSRDVLECGPLLTFIVG